MGRIGLAEREQRVKAFHTIIALASLFVIALTSIYGAVEALREYVTSGVATVGYWFVEFDWPFPYFAKPITYLSVAMVGFVYSSLELMKDWVRRTSRFTKAFISVLALVIAFVSLYEVMYNFMVWNALITADAMRGVIAIDTKNIAYPDPKIPWNLPFATKFFLASFASSLYLFYFLRKNVPDERKGEE